MVKGNKGKIDNLGRIVIPKSIRKALDIDHNDDISMYVENNGWSEYDCEISISCNCKLEEYED